MLLAQILYHFWQRRVRHSLCKHAPWVSVIRCLVRSERVLKLGAHRCGIQKGIKSKATPADVFDLKGSGFSPLCPASFTSSFLSAVASTQMYRAVTSLKGNSLIAHCTAQNLTPSEKFAIPSNSSCRMSSRVLPAGTEHLAFRWPYTTFFLFCFFRAQGLSRA